jgi:hypothetical protein
VTLDPAIGYHDLAGRFGLLVDPAGALDIHQVARRADGWQPSPARPLNLGFSAQVYWLRFAVSNDGPDAAAWLLSLSRTLDRVALYHRGPDGAFQVVTSGKKTPFTARPYDHELINFPIRLAAGSRPPTRTTRCCRATSRSSRGSGSIPPVRAALDCRRHPARQCCRWGVECVFGIVVMPAGSWR